MDYLEMGAPVGIAYRACSWYGGDGPDLVCAIAVTYEEGSSYGIPVTDWVGVSGALGPPAWSPDGTRIAFSDGNEVLSVVLGDLGLTNLTSHPAADHSPSWSPSGAKIVFQSDRDGVPELYIMAADGSNVVRLTRNVGVDGSGAHPDWSPDGARIAFSCVVDGGNRDICVINGDGTGFVRITSDPAADFDPAWTPDGRRIAFVSGRYSQGPQIALMNGDGSGVTRLTYSLGSLLGPDWSPDGGRIVYAGNGGGRGCDAGSVCHDDIVVMTADGTPLQWFNGFDPAWRPVTSPLPPPPPPADDPPVARFSYSCSGLDCAFNSSASSDDNDIVSRAWAFGDGSSVTAFAPNHSYAAAGTYPVTLTITDGAGQTNSATQSVTVSANAPPVASFTASCAGLTCSFDGTGSSDPDGGMLTYAWSFGDGVSGITATAGHTYSDAGTYSVTLTVTDRFGATGTATRNVTTGSPPPAAPVITAWKGYKVKALQKVDLRWSWATTNVDIVRNGVIVIANTANDGFETDHINQKGSGTYTYKLCAAGTSICSAPLTIVF